MKASVNTIVSLLVTIYYEKSLGGGVKLKEWKCVLVGHHDNVGKVIDEWEKAGWRLHTYQTAGMGGTFNYTVNHYLLFVRGGE